MIDEAIEELYKVKSEKEINLFFNQYAYTTLPNHVIHKFEMLPTDTQQWIYHITLEDNRTPEDKAIVLNQLIDIIKYFENKLDIIIHSFNIFRLLYRLYCQDIETLPITEKILTMDNNKTINRLYDIQNLFIEKYGRCFQFCNSNNSIEIVLRNSYREYIKKNYNYIPNLHNKLIPKLNLQHSIVNGSIVLEKPKIIVFEPKETKLGYLITNIKNIPNDILENDDWWYNLFNELVI